MEIVKYMEQSIKKAMDDPGPRQADEGGGPDPKFMGVEEYSKFLEAQNERAKI